MYFLADIERGDLDYTWPNHSARCVISAWQRQAPRESSHHKKQKPYIEVSGWFQTNSFQSTEGTAAKYFFRLFKGSERLRPDIPSFLLWSNGFTPNDISWFCHQNIFLYSPREFKFESCHFWYQFFRCVKIQKVVKESKTFHNFFWSLSALWFVLER